MDTKYFIITRILNVPIPNRIYRWIVISQAMLSNELFEEREELCLIIYFDTDRICIPQQFNHLELKKVTIHDKQLPANSIADVKCHMLLSLCWMLWRNWFFTWGSDVVTLLLITSTVINIMQLCLPSRRCTELQRTVPKIVYEILKLTLVQIHINQHTEKILVWNLKRCLWNYPNINRCNFTQNRNFRQSSF